LGTDWLPLDWVIIGGLAVSVGPYLSPNGQSLQASHLPVGVFYPFMSDQHLTDMRFGDFQLDEHLRRGLADAGFVRCTPIQAQTLPLALAGRGIAGQAQTGTGKTLAFALATLQRLLSHDPDPGRRPRQPRALMVAPTRELAVQVHKDVALLGAHTDLRTLVVYGGTGYQEQREGLAQGVDILIGTPGRLIDYYQQHVFDLRAVEVVVIDEADRMFDLGFIKDIRYLLRRLPKAEHRQGMLFSATLSYRVTELAYEHMNNPVTVAVEPDRVTADKVRQLCYMTANEEKVPLLIGLLRRLEARRTMVFVNTKRQGERVWGFLEGNGIPAGLLTGDVPQKKRLRLLREFQEGALPVLVATDVAARGLHIPDVSHVVNFDLPEDAEDYVHRIGRTARAGASGDAISFACETYSFCLPDIEAFIGHRIEVGAVEPDMLTDVDPRSRVWVEQADREGGGRRVHHKERGRERPKEHRKRREGRHPAVRARAQPAGEAAVPGPEETSTPPPSADAAGEVPKKRRQRRRKAGSAEEETPPVDLPDV
jgi:ATP-dependent RNA helicase RhlB